MGEVYGSSIITISKVQFLYDGHISPKSYSVASQLGEGNNLGIINHVDV